MYQKLDFSKRQIRLIDLEACSCKGGGKFGYALQVFDLIDILPYTALSYRWGEELPNFPIFVNGEMLRVRENLHHFLEQEKQLRGRCKATRYMWIDQITIQQSDTQERTHQVRLMSEIYRCAERVLIWLGPGLDSCSRPDTQYHLSKTDTEWSYYKQLLQDPYFDRLWIAQEIVLAREINVLCGRYWLSWDLMKECVLSQMKFEEKDRKHLFSLFRMSSLACSNNHFSLQECVESFSSMKCHDPRDKIYGMMSMVDPKFALAIDYSKPIHAVFAKTAQIFIDSYLKDDINDTSRALSEFTFLKRLAVIMGFSESQADSLEIMLHSITLAERCGTLVTNKLMASDIQIGFGSGSSLNSNHHNLWWFEINGDRRKFWEAPPTDTDSGAREFRSDWHGIDPNDLDFFFNLK